MGDERTWRLSYELGGLREEDLAPDWLTQFRRWLGDAVAAGLPEPNAMVVATAAPASADTAASGSATQPSLRTVLAREVDGAGFTFFTNLESRKGREALGNRLGSAVFPWIALQRQVVVEGRFEQVTAAQADAYWVTRPYGHRIGALASPQSQVVAGRAALDNRLSQARQRYPDTEPVPRPDHWSGLRLVPVSVEFWQGRRDRLHDRLRFRCVAGAWVVERLAP